MDKIIESKLKQKNEDLWKKIEKKIVTQIKSRFEEIDKLVEKFVE